MVWLFGGWETGEWTCTVHLHEALTPGEACTAALRIYNRGLESQNCPELGRFLGLSSTSGVVFLWILINIVGWVKVIRTPLWKQSNRLSEPGCTYQGSLGLVTVPCVFWSLSWPNMCPQTVLEQAQGFYTAYLIPRFPHTIGVCFESDNTMGLHSVFHILKKNCPCSEKQPVKASFHAPLPGIPASRTPHSHFSSHLPSHAFPVLVAGSFSSLDLLFNVRKTRSSALDLFPTYPGRTWFISWF